MKYEKYGYGAFGLVQKCPHENFQGEVTVGPRYANKDKLCAMVRVKCTDCGTHFRFDGLRSGVFGGDTPSAFPHMGYSVILPIEPLGAMESEIIDKSDKWEAEQPNET